MHPGAVLRRIIPARTGFTPRAGSAGRRSGDHPRSRGVYRGAPNTATSAGGIIPARAGFTRPDWSGSSPRTDHPRSHGVYHYRTHAYKEAYGSSPLARGLPGGGQQGDAAPGIIPARTGFTTCGSLESQRTRTLPDPCRLHCRPGARSAGSRQRRRRSERRPPPLDVTRPPRVSDPGSDTVPTCAGEWRRRPARSGSRRSGGSAPPRSRG